MSKLRFKISMSLDGYVAGPDQSVENPLGVGGMRLHGWVFSLAAWRSTHGLDGGEVNASTPVMEESLANIGATVMGRNMFGGHPGPWDTKTPWTGWWGSNPPFHHPVFVLTHHARAPLALDGGSSSWPGSWTRWKFTWRRRCSAGASGCSTTSVTTCTASSSSARWRRRR